MDGRSAKTPARREIAVITFLLWLATAAVGLFEVYALRQLFSGMLLVSGNEYRTVQTAGLWVLLCLAPLYIAFAIGTAEYHRRHVGQPGSWKLFAVTIVIQAIILVLYLLPVLSGVR